MAEFANWNGHSFIVDARTIRSFTGLTVTGSQETEDKTGDKQKYVAAKNSNPIEVSMTVELNAHLGCDVQAEAFSFVEDARSGKNGYFYMGGKKLVNCPLMLISAQISETVIIANAKWTRCKVTLTLKQCDKYAGSSATGSSGTSGSNTTKQSVKISTSLIQTAIDVGKTIVSNAAPAAKTGGLAEAKQVSTAITAANAVKIGAQVASKAIKGIVQTATTPAKGAAGGKMTVMSK